MTDLYLIAHVVNAQSAESAQVEFEIATEDDGDWFTNSGWQVWPFWTQRIEVEPPNIPDGWLAYLADEAIKYATARAEPKVDLIAQLGLAKPSATLPPLKRRF